MLNSARVSMAGTSLLFLDVLGLILTYEFVSRFVGMLFPRLILSLLAIVVFDQTLFTLIVQNGQPRLMHILFTGLVGKVIAATFYAIVCWLYLKYGEPHTATVGTGDVADVFQTLTYRQKYEQARQRMVRDGLTGLYNRGYFDEVLPQALAHARRHQRIAQPAHRRYGQLQEHQRPALAHGGRRGAAAHRGRHSGAGAAVGHAVPLRRRRVRRAAVGRRRDRRRGVRRALPRVALRALPHREPAVSLGLHHDDDRHRLLSGDGDPASPGDFIRVADRRLYFGKQAGRDIVIAPGQDRDSSWQPAGTA